MSKVTEVPRTSNIQSRTFGIILLTGILGLLAEMTYEGSRSILGPYLGALQAGAVAVGAVAGFGEFLSFSYRWVLGKMVDPRKKFGAIPLLGYAIQMTSVPLLALAGSWPMAAELLVLARVGKALRWPTPEVFPDPANAQRDERNPSRAEESLAHKGAWIGPLIVAGILAWGGDVRLALTTLAVPAIFSMVLVLIARKVDPQPMAIRSNRAFVSARGSSRATGWYLVGAFLLAAGWADFPLVAYHFSRTAIVPAAGIPVLYALAVGVSQATSMIFNRRPGQFSFSVIIWLMLLAALATPLIFLGNFAAACSGMVLWGLGLTVTETLVPELMVAMVPLPGRGSASGWFRVGYGFFWFLGSAGIGILYSISLPALIGFSVALQLAAIPWFIALARKIRQSHPPTEP